MKGGFWASKKKLNWYDKEKVGERNMTCREFGLENFTIQTIWKNKTKIISPFDQNASRTLRFFEVWTKWRRLGAA
jgi:hypothetical protein